MQRRNSTIAVLLDKDDEDKGLTDEKIASIRSKFNKSYFGLPPFAMETTPTALAYRARKTVEDPKHDNDDERNEHQLSNKDDNKAYDDNLDELVHQVDQTLDSNMYMAQRKVSQALLTMVRNKAMLKHFLFKGGLDAVFKLIHESKDGQVLMICTEALLEASQKPESCETLIRAGILSTIVHLNAVGDLGLAGNAIFDDVAMKHMLCYILGNLTIDTELDESLIKGGILNIIQNFGLQTNGWVSCIKTPPK